MHCLHWIRHVRPLSIGSIIQKLENVNSIMDAAEMPTDSRPSPNVKGLVNNKSKNKIKCLFAKLITLYWINNIIAYDLSLHLKKLSKLFHISTHFVDYCSYQSHVMVSSWLHPISLWLWRRLYSFSTWK